MPMHRSAARVCTTLAFLILACMSPACVLEKWHGSDAQARGDSQPARYLEVSEVKGRVWSAPVGADPLDDEGWSQVNVGDTLANGHVLRTTARSEIELVLHPSDPPASFLIRRSALVRVEEMLSAAPRRVATRKPDRVTSEVAMGRVGE